MNLFHSYCIIIRSYTNLVVHEDVKYHIGEPRCLSNGQQYTPEDVKYHIGEPRCLSNGQQYTPEDVIYHIGEHRCLSNGQQYTHEDVKYHIGEPRCSSNGQQYTCQIHVQPIRKNQIKTFKLFLYLQTVTCKCIYLQASHKSS